MALSPAVRRGIGSGVEATGPLSVHLQLEVYQLSREEVLDAWIGLLPNVVGIVVYLVFIFEFYRYVARRDIFELRLRGGARGPISRGIGVIENLLRIGVYFLEYVVLYPVLVIVWYLAFVIFLAFLAPAVATETLLLIAMAVVAATRVTAYYSEDLSRDLAKMLPLALLGVVILEGAEAVAFGQSLALVMEIPAHWRRVMSYLLFLVPLEFVLRVGRIAATGRLATVEPRAAGAGEEPGDDGDDRG